MSVIIPNMKMPMSCLACPLAREMFNCLVCVGYFKDNLTGRRVYKSDLKESDADFNRPDWCPLLPLPAGHGRLIDADVMVEGLMKCAKNPPDDDQNSRWFYLFAAEIAKSCETIVPAEGGTDE